MGTSTELPADGLAIRQPRQERTRQAWARILDAGVKIIEEGGYEAFTIAAVCERAKVAPRAVYDRTSSKDALFLAVYEHGVARVLVDQQVFTEPRRWEGLPPAELITDVVTELTALFARHTAFLKPVLLLSGAHPEVLRRGRGHVHLLADAVTGLLLTVRGHFTHPDPEAGARQCFATAFSACVVRTAHGADFATAPVDHDTFTAHLALSITRTLLAPHPAA
ncbi:MAG TPA: helix-turn-helix domain-containing protein [Streptomyces sp.]|uniref:TetR/AcrR family transcriptional regulator n=1 Tax=Streptomyces sp. TaxID=1931 RepID=UPI002C2FCA5E|nr:helix-turn-helix domain-containing protein [Streptomyces sp.]HWU12324.1 helix-turn-helix domain-containing protein [Streptomyces sp.]